MLKKYEIQVTDIDYDVTEEDVDYLDTEFEETIQTEIECIKRSLPHRMHFKMECHEEDLDDCIANYITNKTNWLIKWAKYNKKEIK